MPAPDATPDPRPQLAASLDQVERQIEALAPDDLGRATPCAEFDAGTLIAHLVAVLRKVTVVRGGGEFAAVADPADDLPDDGRSALLCARAALDRAWSPDSALEERYVLPYGTMTGRELLDAYAHEFTVHAWDLAQVTGREGDLDPALAEAAREWFVHNVPAEERGEGRPFAEAVDVADDAEPYARLAACVGRSVPNG